MIIIEVEDYYVRLLVSIWIGFKWNSYSNRTTRTDKSNIMHIGLVYGSQVGSKVQRLVVVALNIRYLIRA